MMERKFDISIVIPAYRSREYILECLDSIEAQRGIPEVECIIVDDCGEDGTKEVVREFIAAHSGSVVSYRLIEHPENRGVGEARNTGILASRGEYIFFSDSDDSLPPDAISTLWAEAGRHPGVDIVIGGVKSEGWTKFDRFDYELSGAPSALWTEDRTGISRMLLLKEKTSLLVMGQLVRRKLILDNSIFFTPLPYEDDRWHFILAKKVTSLAIVPHNTYIYKRREGSIITSTFDLSDYPGLTLWMARRCGGDCRSIELRYLIRFIIYSTNKRESVLKVRDFRKTLRILRRRSGNFKEWLGIFLFSVSPVPGYLRDGRRFNLPFKLIKPWRAD